VVEPEKRSPLEHPGWGLLLAAAPLIFGIYRGPTLIDDAHITFRYAENLARGRGFVFNTEPLLGVTSPLYCFLLALLRAAGIPQTVSSFALGVAFAALTPILLWRIGVAARRPLAGLVGGFLLALMPEWWLNSKTGMETTLAGFLLALTAWLELRGRSMVSGVSATSLILTRPDAGGFPLLIVAKQLLVDRSLRRVLRFTLAALAALLPWLVYSFLAFGAPFPHSLEAKRLIHFLPWTEGLGRNLGWLTGIREGSAGMLFLFLLWMAGAIAAMRTWREGLPFLIWPAISLITLSLLQIGPFFWYRIPLLPAVALGAGVGFEAIRATAVRARFHLAAASAWVLPAVIPLLLVARNGQWLWKPANLQSVNAKEVAMADMAREIRATALSEGRDPASLTVYVGEVGVIGYDLPEARIIDSSGINSLEVFELRKKDQQRLLRESPQAVSSPAREQSAQWSREVIRIFQPDFIASDERYLHLPELAADPKFRVLYRPLRRWTFPNGVSLVLLQRSLPAALSNGETAGPDEMSAPPRNPP
jgi:hypothetical protein